MALLHSTTRLLELLYMRSSEYIKSNENSPRLSVTIQGSLSQSLILSSESDTESFLMIHLIS